MILLIRRSTPHGPFEILTHRWPEWYLVCHKTFQAEFQAETGVAHNERSYIAVSTPLNDIFRQGVQEMLLPLGEFVTRPLRLL